MTTDMLPLACMPMRPHDTLQRPTMAWQSGDASETPGSFDNETQHEYYIDCIVSRLLAACIGSPHCTDLCMIEVAPTVLGAP